MTAISLTVRSPAKINWCLRVLGRRQDGFHDLASLVSAVTLFDDLVFTGRDAPGIESGMRPGRPAHRRTKSDCPGGPAAGGGRGNASRERLVA